MAYAIHARSPDFQPSDMLVGKALERYPDVTGPRSLRRQTLHE
jgi:hypothetical protein